MVYIADFADFLKIKQETIRKCHTCSELHQAAPLNCSGGMHLCLSVTSTLLLEKKKKKSEKLFQVTWGNFQISFHF